MIARSRSTSRDAGPCPGTTTDGFIGMIASIARSQPRLSALPTNGMRPANSEVAREQHAFLDDEHQQVVGGVRAARVDDAERDAAEAEVGVAVEPDVRPHDARVLVDPGEQVALALLEALGASAGREVRSARRCAQICAPARFSACSP